ncbi:MAG: HAD hydrolase-like protein [Sedimentisphaerales bacterium]|nr:HAD hydrolase-like protein [Sedimentisphaerales bacterium]
MISYRICLDLDNVLADTDKLMRSIIYEFTEGDVDLRYQDITTFNYWECNDKKGNFISKEQWSEIHDVFSRSENILTVEPYPEIQEYLNQIAGKFALHIVTTRLRAARKPTVEWLECHNFPEHSLHFVEHGKKHIALGEFKVSVEDHREQAEQFAAIGTTSYILAHPLNETTSNSATIRLQDWRMLCEHIVRQN